MLLSFLSLFIFCALLPSCIIPCVDFSVVNLTHEVIHRFYDVLSPLKIYCATLSLYSNHNLSITLLYVLFVLFHVFVFNCYYALPCPCISFWACLRRFMCTYLCFPGLMIYVLFLFYKLSQQKNVGRLPCVV